MKAIPSVLLAWASSEGSTYLQEVEEEIRWIKRSFSYTQARGFLSVMEKRDPTVQDLNSELYTLKKNIVGFHFAGHSNNQSLALKREEALFKGISQHLISMPSLKFIFLNGCSNFDRANYLSTEGIPAVIGTRAKVNDLQAKLFSDYFYQNLTLGYSLNESFENAKSSIEGHKNLQINPLENRNNQRDLCSETNGTSRSGFPWEILFNPSRAAGIRDWRIPGLSSLGTVGQVRELIELGKFHAARKIIDDYTKAYEANAQLILYESILTAEGEPISRLSLAKIMVIINGLKASIKISPKDKSVLSQAYAIYLIIILEGFELQKLRSPFGSSDEFFKHLAKKDLTTVDPEILCLLKPSKSTVTKVSSFFQNNFSS